eukprot:3900996-Rhodomonas_salina.4
MTDNQNPEPEATMQSDGSGVKRQDRGQGTPASAVPARNLARDIVVGVATHAVREDRGFMACDSD